MPIRKSCLRRAAGSSSGLRIAAFRSATLHLLPPAPDRPTRSVGHVTTLSRPAP
ncbi:hypothetical protein ACQEVG_27435 [Streptomyces sp. CA-135486]|uniref:hypothetical protein n=1 Tax=Streptomyces sp. CA-135486 TaxID=3240049 RepID=UPI003D8E3639